MELSVTHCSASSPSDPMNITNTDTAGSFVIVEAICFGLIKYLFKLASLKFEYYDNESD